MDVNVSHDRSTTGGSLPLDNMPSRVFGSDTAPIASSTSRFLLHMCRHIISAPVHALIQVYDARSMEAVK